MFKGIQDRLEELLHVRTHVDRAKVERLTSSSSSSKYSLGPSGSSSDSADLFHSAASHLSLPPLAPILKNQVGVIDSPSMHPEAEEDQMATYGFPPVQAEMTIEDLRSFFSSRSFLIVDDNPINLVVLSRLLQKAGITNYIKAESGPQAIELAKTHAFDVVIMDFNMPEMNGDVAIKLIRGIPGHDKLPIILGYTANDDAQVKADFLAAGANDSVIKPLLEHDLLRKIYDLYLDVTTSH